MFLSVKERCIPDDPSNGDFGISPALKGTPMHDIRAVSAYAKSKNVSVEDLTPEEINQFITHYHD